jgi:hypothetical protein
MEVHNNREFIFENVWKKSIPEVNQEVLAIWKQVGGLTDVEAEKRLHQLVFIVRDEHERIVGISTAYKAYIKQLKNYLYAFRCMLVPDCRIPGLTSKLVVETRDFLESIHESEGTDKAIGIITLVENERIKQHRNEAVWPASKMVYIGNSKEGHHIRVYYFKGARINP